MSDYTPFKMNGMPMIQGSNSHKQAVEGSSPTKMNPLLRFLVKQKKSVGGGMRSMVSHIKKFKDGSSRTVNRSNARVNSSKRGQRRSDGTRY